MKRLLKVALVAVLAVSVIGAAFAFTNKHESKKLDLPRYFKFVGSTSSTSDLTDPQLWIETTDAPLTDSHTGNFVSQLQVINSESTYIYLSGTNEGHPKVDITDSDLQNDVLQAGGHGSPSGVQEIFQSDYEITKNNTQRS
jgi:hypothetical protein